MEIPQTPPRFKSKRDRERWSRVCEDLIAHGLDPRSRTELIADFIDAEQQIAALRPTAQGSADVRLAQARALTNAKAERRRLHQRLFAGGKRVDEPLPPIETAIAEIVVAPASEADEAWRDRFWDEAKRPKRRLPLEEAELEQRYGPPSWAALLYPTVEAQARGERALDSYWNARPTQKKRRLAQGSVDA